MAYGLRLCASEQAADAEEAWLASPSHREKACNFTIPRGALPKGLYRGVLVGSWCSVGFTSTMANPHLLLGA